MKNKDTVTYRGYTIGPDADTRWWFAFHPSVPQDKFFGFGLSGILDKVDKETGNFVRSGAEALV